jgi:hypothetical protein
MPNNKTLADTACAMTNGPQPSHRLDLAALAALDALG